MIITKEHQEAMVLNYENKGHNIDECLGFIDGMKEMFELVNKKYNDDRNKQV